MPDMEPACGPVTGENHLPGNKGGHVFHDNASFPIYCERVYESEIWPLVSIKKHLLPGNPK